MNLQLEPSPLKLREKMRLKRNTPKPKVARTFAVPSPPETAKSTCGAKAANATGLTRTGGHTVPNTYHPEKVPDRHADEDYDDRGDDADLLEQRPAEISDTGVPLEQKRRQRQDKPHPKVAAAKHDGGTRNTKKATCKSKPK